MTTTPEPLLRLPDGTVKQISPLTGTTVWTVPGRGHRPLPGAPARRVEVVSSASASGAAGNVASNSRRNRNSATLAPACSTMLKPRCQAQLSPSKVCSQTKLP